MSNDHISALIAAVTSQQPIDDREKNSIAEFLRVVPTLTDACNEQASDVHVTASAIVVSDAGDKVALHLHKRLNMWLQPGGHIESGELAHVAALREATEETGLPVRHVQEGGLFFHVDVHPGPRGHTHHDVRYLVRSPEVAPAPLTGESQQVKWFSWDDAVEIADAGLVGALLAAKAFLHKE